jgi:flagellar export protein FliJ
MKGLPTLIKLQKSRVDEQQVILSKLQNHLEQIEGAIVALEIEKVREAEAKRKNPALGITYAAYLDAALRRGEKLERDRLIAQQAVNLAHDQLSQLFEEQKRYEIALANREAAEEREEKRKESIEMNEIGSIAFERRRKA